MKKSGHPGRSASSLAWIPLALLALSACSGAPSTDNAVNVTAVGPVTGFGSVKVGGAAFYENSATTIVDDRGRKIDNVVEGMALTIRGTIDLDFQTGSAGTITIERAVRGPIDDGAVDLANNSILVTGQTVLVNPATVMVRSGGGEFDLGDLKTDQGNNLRPELEVHGARDDRGFLHATFVERGRDNVKANDNVGLQGEIQGLIGNTFRIGGQKVDYTGLPADGRVNWPLFTGLSNGLVVDVRGRLDAVGGSGTVRTDRAGDRIEVKETSIGEPQERALIEGYVVSGTIFSFGMSVPGGTVTVTGGVAPTGGTFLVGQRVQVKGTIVGTSGTTVQPSAALVMRPNEVLMEGAPDKGSIDPSAGTMKLLGQQVAVDDLTLFRDGTGAVRNDFGLASLSDSNTVRVVGWFDNSKPPGQVVATRVDRLSLTAPDNVTAQGVVSDKTFLPGSFTILGLPGIVVNAGLKTNTDYFLAGGVPTIDATFFANLAVGTTVVKVKRGVYEGGPPRIFEPDPGSSLGTMEVEIVQVNN